MEADRRRERISRRDEDTRRLRKLTVVGGVLGVGLFAGVSLVAASSQPGRAIAATGGSSGLGVQGSGAVATDDSGLQGPAQVPFQAGNSVPMAVSGGS
ncbi:MAG: hypothetical protein ACYDAG_11715 [Chloroflexota bacterium]